MNVIMRLCLIIKAFINKVSVRVQLQSFELLQQNTKDSKGSTFLLLLGEVAKGYNMITDYNRVLEISWIYRYIYRLYRYQACLQQASQ